MHRWRPVIDESAQNSLNGSQQGSQITGAANTGNSRILGFAGETTGSTPGTRAATRATDLTPRTSNRTSNDQSDYFRRPSMRSAMSHMSETSSVPVSRLPPTGSIPLTRTDTGRTDTTNDDRTSRPYGTATEITGTGRTRTETTGLSRNQSMKTNTTETNRTQTGVTVSRNTSMSTTRTHNTVHSLNLNPYDIGFSKSEFCYKNSHCVAFIRKMINKLIRDNHLNSELA